MAKRARKYYLGITTITQDVEDFIHNDYGRAIVTNSSIQFLMKQSSAALPALIETFHLSEGERRLLVSSDVGEGIFFAGQNHVALRVVASDQEHRVITTNPEEILAQRAASTQNKIKQTLESTEDNVPKVSTSRPNKPPLSTTNPVAPVNRVATTPATPTHGGDRPQKSANKATQVFSTTPPSPPIDEDEEVKPKQKLKRPTEVFSAEEDDNQLAGHYSIDDYAPPKKS